VARDRRRRDRRLTGESRRPPASEEISPAARELARVFGDAARGADHAALAAHGAPVFTVAPSVARAALMRPYEPRPGDPPLRALRVFARLPGEGAPLVATVRIPWEPLLPGPTGSTLAIEVEGASALADADQSGGAVDLEAPQPVAYAGFAPVPDDPRYVAQLCYAAACGTWHRWRGALGRDPAWGFDRPMEPGAEDAPRRLHVAASAAGGARYDATGVIITGTAEGALGGAGPRRALSHDDVARATARAVLHGLRPHLAEPCNADAPALRDALADLTATLQRASWRETARAALLDALAGASGPQALVDVGARMAAAIRGMDAVGDAGVPDHDGVSRAALLTAAVWDAFAAVWARRVQPIVRVAGGTDTLAPDGAGEPLLDLLGASASATASHLLCMCLRAVDYLPPVDATFGDWLRAAITADRELVPDDRWRYREALVTACERRGIAPHHAGVADTEALAWPSPARVTPPLRGLDFAMAQFAGDPAHAPDAEELERQATVLGRVVAHPQWSELFGLADPSRADHRLRLLGDTVSLPCVESVRVARRVGPGGRIVFEVVAEVTQCRVLRAGTHGPALEVTGGATVIAGPTGELRWIVARSLLDDERLARHRAWAAGEGARGYAMGEDGVLRAVGEDVAVAEEAW
jgi:hypothetical protein